jgi:chorismate synthase
VAGRPGSQVHDPILPGEKGGYPQRASNNAGGIEGGMTNGQPVVVRGAMKPISTLLRGLPSVDLRSGEALSSDYERSDVCALPAASVVMEQVVAFEIACVLREKFGGDSLEEVQAQLACHDQLARQKLGLTD